MAKIFLLFFLFPVSNTLFTQINYTNNCLYYILGIIFLVLTLIILLIINKKTNRLLKLKDKKINSQKELIRTNGDLLLQHTQELLTRNAQKDKFYSVISHDLRGFVSTIKGFADLITLNKNNLPEGQIEKYISLISKTSDSTMELLNNLLEWSRSQQGKLMYNPEKVNLYTLVKDVLYFLAPLVEKKMIKASNKVNRNILVLGDKGMLFSILRNLITNAIKFTYPEGEIIIDTEDQTDRYIIHVKDYGVGIDKIDIPKLFIKEKIYSTLGTNDEPGSGIGLQICKEFIELHDQEIGVTSSLGEGSDFWFSLNKYKD